MDPTAQTQATLDALTARLPELEAAHATQQKRSAALEHENERLSRPVTRFGRKPAGTVAVQTAPAERSSRRRMLGTAAKVVVATAGAGVLAEQVGTRTAFADNYGNFSSVSGTPAVVSSGTNGAGALKASSDSGFAIAAYSTTGSAIYASGGGGVGVQATGANQGVSGSTGAISARASTAPSRPGHLRRQHQQRLGQCRGAGPQRRRQFWWRARARHRRSGRDRQRLRGLWDRHHGHRGQRQQHQLEWSLWIHRQQHGQRGLWRVRDEPRCSRTWQTTDPFAG